MSQKQDLLPIEREWQQRLQFYSSGPCLQAPEIIELAEQGRRNQDYEKRMAHVLVCGSCREAYAAAQSNLALEKHSRKARFRWFRIPWRFAPTENRRWIAAGAGGLAAVVAALLWFSRPIVALKDGGRQVALNGLGRLTGGLALPPDLESASIAALRTGRMETPTSLRRLTPPLTAGQAPANFWTRGPVATVIAARQPEFAWRLPTQATGCYIHLIRVDETGHVLERKRFDMSKVNAKAEQWKPKKPLLPGGTYWWQMAAYDRNHREIASAPERQDAARFQVLSLEQAETVSRVRSTLKDSHLALGIFYARQGLMDDAKREIETLQMENPGSNVVKSLEQSLRMMRGGV